MSERGSITSQYFYCRDCCDATFKVFEENYEYVTLVMVPDSMSATNKSYPIIVTAKTHSGYPGEEIDEFQGSVVEELSKVLCHPARFAILPDDERSEGVFAVTPFETRAEPIMKMLT